MIDICQSWNNSLVIANPSSNRVGFWQAALERQGLPASHLISWADLIVGKTHVADHFQTGDVIRIESPGRDYNVERLILEAGADLVHSPVVAEDPEDRGLIRSPRQWYLGFRTILERVDLQLAQCPPHTILSPPKDIATLFDKRQCHQRLCASGVPVPGSLGPIGSYNELIARMRQTGAMRVFLKLAYGSSGSGVVAFEMSGDKQQATTTVDIVESNGFVQLYNSRKIRKYSDPATIRTIVDLLCGEDVHVEQWLPKAGMNGGAFDMRVVTVAGEPCHVVGRISQSPITNLHLLNRRADADAVRAHVGPDAWTIIIDAARRAASCFPDCLHVGVDVMINPRHDKVAVLEVNAFGDLLPGSLVAIDTDDGPQMLDTYEAEIMALRRKAMLHA